VCSSAEHINGIMWLEWRKSRQKTWWENLEQFGVAESRNIFYSESQSNALAARGFSEGKYLTCSPWQWIRELDFPCDIIVKGQICHCRLS
jgi:hypothetical protein